MAGTFIVPFGLIVNPTKPPLLISVGDVMLLLILAGVLFAVSLVTTVGTVPPFADIVTSASLIASMTGRGVGLGVGLGVGVGVASCIVNVLTVHAKSTGCGVGVTVGRTVGEGVGLGVGVAVGGNTVIVTVAVSQIVGADIKQI